MPYKGAKGKVPIGIRTGDEQDEDEKESMVCQMAGEKWEQLFFPIIIDFFACISVMPTSWGSHVPTEETKESMAGGIVQGSQWRKDLQ